MRHIQDLFDPSKQLNRRIESVVTFGAKTETDLSSEIKEYVVTEKLRRNYEDVISDLQTAFNNGSNEVGIWVSGFYGSGKSSFAKYLGLSFDKSLLIDGVTFGDKLMSRIQDQALTAMHKTVISQHNPLVVMIDLSTEAVAGKNANVSDIIYNETLKLLGITKCTDQKVMCFIELLKTEGRYEEFISLVQTEKGRPWEVFEENNLMANAIAQNYAPRLLPAYFPDKESFKNVTLDSALNDKERFIRLQKLIKEATGRDKVIFVLDEVGQYVSSNVNMILNLQGLLHIFKDQFKGSMWVIATAQQTLTEDNRDAQLNSSELYRLNDRFPVKVDIEANDIKEIITKRLLGKSKEGQNYLEKLFIQNEGVLKNNTHLEVQEKSIFNQVLTDKIFADLYPFLPVHIDILLSLLQKLASRTGGVGLRSVIRLIRDILVESQLAATTIGQLAGPEHFYDVLKTDMEKHSSTKEIVYAADNAIRMFNGNSLAIRISKTIAMMQLLDDFNLSFDNLCALLYNHVGDTTNKTQIRDCIDQIVSAPGLTLQEVDGRFQFMTNAILGIREERDKITPREAEKAEVMKTILKDILWSAPSVNIYMNKTIEAGVDIIERGQTNPIFNGSNSGIKINVRFVEGCRYEETHKALLSESTRKENNSTLFWICTLPNDQKEYLLQDIVKSQSINNRHANETNKEILAYLRAQKDNAQEKMRLLSQILRDAQKNSEIIHCGNPQGVNEVTYKTVALKTISEKIYEKYEYANANMPAKCVSTLAQYSDLKGIPTTINPLNIIKNDTIDTSHRALLEIKDFISSEVTGADIFVHFERSPYGWTKDTIRYLIALMLKAGVVQLRVTGKDITIFSDTALEALDTNNAFTKISISLNTAGALTPQEMMEASKRLTELFGSPRTALTKDAIAKEAYKQIKMFKGQIDTLATTFTQYNLAGLPTVKQASGYAAKINDSEGGEAAFLLGKDDTCYKAFKYVADILKEDKRSSFLDQLKNISKLVEKASQLPDTLENFRAEMDNVNAVYNSYIANTDLCSIISDITDLKNLADANVKTACIEFLTSSNKTINEEIDKVKNTAEYCQLTDEQKQIIDVKLNTLPLSSSNNTVEGLRAMADTYASLFIPKGRFDTIRKQVNDYASANKAEGSNTIGTGSTTTTVTDNENGATTTKVSETENVSTTGETNSPKSTGPVKKTISVKSKISTKTELKKLIDDLNEIYTTSSAEDLDVEFSIN